MRNPSLRESLRGSRLNLLETRLKQSWHVTMAELIQENVTEPDTSSSKPNEEDNEADSPDDAGGEEEK